jgi:flavorubredoxin
MALVNAMKTLLAVVVSAFAVSFANAADKKDEVPRGAYTPATYEDAKTKATSEKKLIVYMWSQMNSSCPMCEAGTTAALKAFKNNKKYVLVFGSGDSSDHAPASLRESLSEATTKVGNSMPLVMIVDPANEKPLASASYKQFAKDDRIWKKIQKEAETAAGMDKK